MHQDTGGFPWCSIACRLWIHLEVPPGGPPLDLLHCWSSQTRTVVGGSCLRLFGLPVAQWSSPLDPAISGHQTNQCPKRSQRRCNFGGSGSLHGLLATWQHRWGPIILYHPEIGSRPCSTTAWYGKSKGGNMRTWWWCCEMRSRMNRRVRGSKSEKYTHMAIIDVLPYVTTVKLMLFFFLTIIYLCSK